MKMTLSRVLFLFLLGGLIFTSCQEDTPGGGGGTGTEDEMQVSAVGNNVVTVGPADTIYVTITATKGESPLNSITVAENSVNLPLERVLWDGTVIANPLLLADGDKTTFTKEIGVIVNAAPGSYTYTYTIADESNSGKVASVEATVEATAPVFSYMGSAARSVAPGSSLSLKYSAVQGTGEIDMIKFLIDGELVSDVSGWEFNGQDITMNPDTLRGANRTSFDDASLIVKAPTTPGNYTLTTVLIDEFGNEVSQDVNLIVGTTPASFIEAVFFNRLGSKNGAMDLDNGTNVSSSSTASEIRDMGVDDTIDPTQAENWLMAIEPVNGAAMGQLIPGENGLSESFSWDNLRFSEDIIAAVSSASALANGSNTGKVSVGDMFILSNEAGSRNYVFIVREVNPVDESNDDNYVIDIKHTN